MTMLGLRVNYVSLVVLIDSRLRARRKEDLTPLNQEISQLVTRNLNPVRYVKPIRLEFTMARISTSTLGIFQKMVEFFMVMFVLIAGDLIRTPLERLNIRRS
jgi:hypothetical protein